MGRIEKAYMALVGGTLLLLLLISVTFYRQVYYVDSPTYVQKLSADEVVKSKGNYIFISQILPEAEYGDLLLAFYTVHQEVKVEMDGEVIYEIYAGDNLFGETPGSGWNYISVPLDKMGTEMNITLRATYDAFKDRVPEFLFGTRMDIVKEIVFPKIVSILICMLTIIVGIVLTLYGIVLRKRVHQSTELSYLGIFAMALGMWSLNEAVPIPLASDIVMFSTYLDYISLRLLTIPLLLFIRGMVVNKKSILWKVGAVLSLVEAVVSIGLQVFGIVNFRDTLIGVHTVYIFCMGCVAYIIGQESYRKILTRKMKVNLIFIGFIFVGFVADIFIYYKSVEDSNMIGRVCFLIYIVALGILSVQDVIELANKGKEAEIYHRLAFSDVLTGCYNRTAYVRHISNGDKGELERIQVFMLDLNNLKDCNDNYGHTVGDNYIIHASNFIMNIFSKNAKIYRIGGDEFCVLTSGLGLSEIQGYLDEIEKFQIELPVNNGLVKGCIACGFAQYEPGDADIYAVARRADAKMYENKTNMKCKMENVK